MNNMKNLANKFNNINYEQILRKKIQNVPLK